MCCTACGTAWSTWWVSHLSTECLIYHLADHHFRSLKRTHHHAPSFSLPAHLDRIKKHFEPEGWLSCHDTLCFEMKAHSYWCGPDKGRCLGDPLESFGLKKYHLFSLMRNFTDIFGFFNFNKMHFGRRDHFHIQVHWCSGWQALASL